MLDLPINIKKEVTKKFGKIISISQLKKNKRIYKIESLKKIIRLDITDEYCKWWDIHNFASENGINVPKELFRFFNNKMYFRICEFIQGVYPNSCDNVPDAYIKSGEEMAKLNNLKPNTELFGNDDIFIDDFRLTNSDFSSPNAIYTQDRNIFMIDTNTFKILKLSSGQVDFTLIKPLLRWTKNRTNIDYFLRGYLKFRDTKNIIKLCEVFNWEWNPDLFLNIHTYLRRGGSLNKNYFKMLKKKNKKM